MTKENAIVMVSKQILMSRSGANEPFAALTWDDLDKLSTAIAHDLLVAATRVPDCDVFFYRKQDEPLDEFLNPLRKKVNFCEVQGESFAGEIRAAVDHAFASQYRRVIAVLEYHPLISQKFFSKIFDRLTFDEDCVVMGPTIDGRCFLIGMKSNHSDVFISADADLAGKSDNLLRRLCEKDTVLFLTPPRTMLDSGYNLAHLRDTMELPSTEDQVVPKRTLEVLKKIEKKYKVKHHAR
jgi:glycosyltransferase A (GT-A) superfamily protein (DUF2064 family)